MKIGIVIFLFPMIAWGGSWETSGDYYSREETLRTASVRSGTVLTAREVTLEPSDQAKAASTTVGAAIGGVLTHAAFGKKGGIVNSILSSGIGGVLGGVMGYAAAAAWLGPRGCEIMIKLDNGDVIAVVQQEDRCPQPGQRVDLVTTWEGKTRVVPR